jgi:hypothetical protein
MQQSYRTFQKNKKPNLQWDGDVSYGTSQCHLQCMEQTIKNFLDIRQARGGNIFCNVGKIVLQENFLYKWCRHSSGLRSFLTIFVARSYISMRQVWFWCGTPIAVCFAGRTNIVRSNRTLRRNFDYFWSFGKVANLWVQYHQLTSKWIIWKFS